MLLRWASQHRLQAVLAAGALQLMIVLGVMYLPSFLASRSYVFQELLVYQWDSFYQGRCAATREHLWDCCTKALCACCVSKQPCKCQDCKCCCCQHAAWYHSEFRVTPIDRSGIASQQAAYSNKP